MMRRNTKEEVAIVLDFLPHGYPFDSRPMHQKTAIAQAMGKNFFTLLELVPKKGEFLQPHEEVYIGDGKRDNIHHIVGKVPLSKLTQTAKMELDFVIEKMVDKNEEKFIAFFNKAGPINMRVHQLELLPSIGKKHTLMILEEREESPFESFEDLKKRVKLVPDPKKTIVRRIYAELDDVDKHKLFVRS